MLYDALLHEIGHLQLIDAGARSARRRFALERRAREFADRWRGEMWAEVFDHHDPVHNPPSREELQTIGFA